MKVNCCYSYIKNIIAFFIIFIVLFSTTVRAAISWDQVKEKYKENSAIVNTLSEGELREWKSAIQKKKNELRLLGTSQTNPGQNSQEQMLCDEILGKVNAALAKIEEEKEKEEEKENEGKTEEEIKEDKDEKMKKYNIDQIEEWLLDEDNDSKNLSEEVKTAWKETILNSQKSDSYKTQLVSLLEDSTYTQAQDEVKNYDDTIYEKPENTGSLNAGESLDDVIGDAEQFIGLGTPQYGGNLADFSNTIYNILLSVGVVVAVIVGAVIGVKLMASNIDTKVEAKKLLIPYVVGCVVVFGGFAIWKIVVSVLQGV